MAMAQCVPVVMASQVLAAGLMPVVLNVVMDLPVLVACTIIATFVPSPLTSVVFAVAMDLLVWVAMDYPPPLPDLPLNMIGVGSVVEMALHVSDVVVFLLLDLALLVSLLELQPQLHLFPPSLLSPHLLWLPYCCD